MAAREWDSDACLQARPLRLGQLPRLSMVISLAKRVFSVDFGGALPAAIRSRTWSTRPESIDLVVMLARRAAIRSRSCWAAIS